MCRTKESWEEPRSNARAKDDKAVWRQSEAPQETQANQQSTQHTAKHTLALKYVHAGVRDVDILIDSNLSAYEYFYVVLTLTAQNA